MIRRQGDYYQIEYQPNQPQPQLPENPPQSVTLTTTGNVKETLSEIRARLNELKSQKERERRSKGHGEGLIGVGENRERERDREMGENRDNLLSITLSIPDELLTLQKRISDLEGRINANELFRQKYEKKGTIVDRVRALHKQLQKLVEKRSPQITINNIQTYCTYLDQKQQHMKPLFLYQALQTTRSLNDQILILEEYLSGLAKIQAKLNAGIPLQQLIQTHKQLLSARKDISKSIRALFSKIKVEYESIQKEMKEIEQCVM